MSKVWIFVFASLVAFLGVTLGDYLRESSALYEASQQARGPAGSTHKGTTIDGRWMAGEVEKMERARREAVVFQGSAATIRP
jgi:hypothetical protein